VTVEISRPVQGVVGVLVLAIVGMAAFPTVQAEWRRSADWEHAAQLDGAAKASASAFVATVDGDWPAYRGPSRDGLSADVGLLASWPDDGPPEMWRRPVGGGHAGFVVGGGRAFTIEQRRDEEAVVAYDLASGAELWATSWSARFSESMGGDGPRATPTLDGGRVYAYGANGHLVAADAATGAVAWQHEVLADLGMPNLQWGMSSSPLVTERLVVVSTSGKEGPGLVAYDKASGEEVWTTEWLLQGYTSPVLVDIGGVSQILQLAGMSLVGIDPANGDILWSFEWETFKGISAAQPQLLAGDRVFICTGYDKGSALVQLSNDGGWSASATWTEPSLQCQFNSAVILDETIYALSDGRLVAHDLADGSRLWRGDRYGNGQLMYADGGLLVVGEDGLFARVRASGDAFEEQGRVRALDGRTWAVPALAGGRLLVRNEREAAAYDLRVR
jgi:outer membrane protein assembly factor BamB